MDTKFLATILAPIGRHMAKRYANRGPVVAITGSAGKTSTKEAIGLLTDAIYHHKAIVSSGNLNNDIGLPLSLVGFKQAPSPLAYPYKILQAWWRALLMPLPPAYILEYGIDKPGDMTHLASIIRPNIIVYTNIGNVHLENYPNHQALIDEKMSLARYMTKDGLIIYNGDNKILTEQIGQLPTSQTISFGYNQSNDLHIHDVEIRSNSTVFTIRYKGDEHRFESRALGRQHVLAVVPAIALGLFWRADMPTIAKAIEKYEPQPGRGNIVFGRKDTVIINDTYNASPIATLAALDVLAAMPGQSKLAVLGDMLELGSASVGEHREILNRALKSANVVFTVGKRMGQTKLGHKHFDSPMAAIDAVKEQLKPGMIILVKGSQGMRMEILVKAIMLEPSQASKLLPRQSDAWLKKPFKEV